MKMNIKTRNMLGDLPCVYEVRIKSSAKDDAFASGMIDLLILLMNTRI
jgi:hypothetical protein